MPKVSVIIPVYNAEKYISDAIESVIAQTYKNWEIVAVNDGSIDRSPEILKDYEDQYPNKIRVIHQPNSGLSMARNIAISAANGEYIAFLDADDLWLPEKTEEQVHLLDINSDIGLVYTDVYELQNKKLKKKRRIIGGKMFRGNVFNSLFYFNFIPVLSVMVRKSVLDDRGIFNPKFYGTQDYDLWMRIVEKYQIDFVDSQLAIYRIHEQNMSTNVEKMMQEDIELMERWVEKKPYLSSSFKYNIKKAQIQYNIGIYHLNTKRFFEALNDFALGFSYLIHK